PLFKLYERLTYMVWVAGRWLNKKRAPLFRGGKVVLPNGLYGEDIEELLFCLPRRLQEDVLAAVYQWQYYLEDAMGLAGCLLNDGHRKEDVRLVMKAAIEKARESCGSALEALGARCFARWRLATPKSIATPIQPCRPRYRPPSCPACGKRCQV